MRLCFRLFFVFMENISLLYNLAVQRALQVVDVFLKITESC